MHAVPLARFPLFILAAALLAPGCASPEPEPTPHPVAVSALVAEAPVPRLSTPRHIGAAEPGSRGPAWTRGGDLLHEAPRALHGLTRVEKPGRPVFDPSSDAWFASANGAIVRVQEHALTVVAEGVQGADIDVRSEAAIAVSREPNNTIVLHRFGKSGANATVLFAGPGFFHPRLSPKGDAVLVSDGRTDGTRIWVAPVGGEPREVAPGEDATWHPDGRRIVFVRLRNDGHTLLSSELWVVDSITREERRVGPVAVPAVRPAVSPDGRMVAFADGRSGDVYLAAFDDPFAQGGR